MKENKLRKFLFPIGAVALATIPLVSVVSCSDSGSNNDESETPSNGVTSVSDAYGRYQSGLGLTVEISGQNLPLSISNYSITYLDDSTFPNVERNVEFLLSKESTSTNVVLYRPYYENDPYLGWIFDNLKLNVFTHTKKEIVKDIYVNGFVQDEIRKYKDNNGFEFNENGVITKYQPTNSQPTSITIPETLVDFSSGTEVKVKGIGIVMLLLTKISKMFLLTEAT